MHVPYEICKALHLKVDPPALLFLSPCVPNILSLLSFCILTLVTDGKGRSRHTKSIFQCAYDQNCLDMQRRWQYSVQTDNPRTTRVVCALSACPLHIPDDGFNGLVLDLRVLHRASQRVKKFQSSSKVLLFSDTLSMPWWTLHTITLMASRYIGKDINAEGLIVFAVPCYTYVYSSLFYVFS